MLIKKIRKIKVSLILVFALSAGIFFNKIPTVKAAADIDAFGNPQDFIAVIQAPNQDVARYSAFGGAVSFSFPAQSLREEANWQILKIQEDLPEPWNVKKVSAIYQFDFSQDKSYDRTKPFTLQISYDVADNYLKQIYFFDKSQKVWRPLTTRYDVKRQVASAATSMPYARVAVFANPEIKITGEASWYRYKNGNFAASTDFSKGSRLRVTNVENGKFVDVDINDYGPDKARHPGRILDLDAVAFKKIASTRDGIINISIEPLFVPEKNGRVLGIKISGVSSELAVNAAAAVLLDNNSGEIIYNHNAGNVVPLASLTKVVTASVFLDTAPDFNAVVSYSAADENYNYQYADKYEVARLALKDGDQLTVKDLFFTTLIASTNNTAETLARVSGLPRDEFIARMNDKVREWEATSTVFVEPSGLAPENVSTALDYAIITKNAFRQPELLAATTLSQYKFTTLRDKKKVTARNTNDLLYSNFYITGGKTGYLDEAGYCLMTKIRIRDDELTGVILGADTRDQSFEEMNDLLKYGTLKLESL